MHPEGGWGGCRECTREAQGTGEGKVSHGVVIHVGAIADEGQPADLLLLDTRDDSLHSPGDRLNGLARRSPQARYMEHPTQHSAAVGRMSKDHRWWPGRVGGAEGRVKAVREPWSKARGAVPMGTLWRGRLGAARRREGGREGRRETGRKG